MNSINNFNLVMKTKRIKVLSATVVDGVEYFNMGAVMALADSFAYVGA